MEIKINSPKDDFTTNPTDISAYSGLYKCEEDGTIMRLCGTDMFLVTGSTSGLVGYCCTVDDWSGVSVVNSVPPLRYDPYGIRFEGGKILTNPNGILTEFKKIDDVQLFNGRYKGVMQRGLPQRGEFENTVDGIFLTMWTPDGEFKYYHFVYNGFMYRMFTPDMFKEPFEAENRVICMEAISNINSSGYFSKFKVKNLDITVGYMKQYQ